MKHGLDQNDNQEEVKDTKKMSWDEKYGKKKGKKKGKKGLIIALIIIVAVVGLGANGYSKAKGAAQALSDSLGDGTLVEEVGGVRHVDCACVHLTSHVLEKVRAGGTEIKRLSLVRRRGIGTR